ncbi:MAG: DUF1178 family protein [Acidiferrobacterales bacterium]|nr:DUF1178 family protein [Acidiferrobacterales bacterium]
MVIYDICCDKQHQFEGWFREPGDFTRQLEKGLLDCPVCGSHDVRKLPTGSKILVGENRHSKFDEDRLSTDNVAQAVEELSAYIEQNFTDVGEQFPEEARKVYYGESDLNNIYGNANSDEVAELQEEGIEVIPIPVPMRNRKKLN